jgi:hypothetical protein
MPTTSDVVAAPLESRAGVWKTIGRSAGGGASGSGSCSGADSKSGAG